MLLVFLGWLLGPLGSLLEASWGHHRASWQPLGGLLGLLASSLGLLAASWAPFGGLLSLLASSLGLLAAPWAPFGCLLGVSWDLFAGLEAEKWPWLEREYDF